MTAPGWYPDPSGVSRQRYFDGKQWTDSYAPYATAATPPPPPAQSTPAPKASSLDWWRQRSTTQRWLLGGGAGIAVLLVAIPNAMGANNKPASSLSSSPTSSVSPSPTATAGAWPTVAAAAPTTPTPQGPPVHSKLLDVTLPPGSTPSADEPDPGEEDWDVPLNVHDEIANLRPQLPINNPFDGLTYCGHRTQTGMAAESRTFPKTAPLPSAPIFNRAHGTPTAATAATGHGCQGSEGLQPTSLRIILAMVLRR
jgi:hypothetical protein